MDNNSIVLEHLSESRIYIDIVYKQANFDEKEALAAYRNQAFDLYQQEKDRLLINKVTCTDQDVEEMKRIRKAIEQAANVQILITRIKSLINFFRLL